MYALAMVGYAPAEFLPLSHVFDPNSSLVSPSSFVLIALVVFDLVFYLLLFFHPFALP
jgi:hypothetical protein